MTTANAASARRYTRRRFLRDLGVVGGAATTLHAMEAIGLMAPAAADTVDFTPPSPSDFSLQGRANDTSVVILGAGIAGLTTAYELQKAGYRCQVLEARSFAGGRNWTARNGTTLVETDGTTQRAEYDEGQYFNTGPARIPQHHTTIPYCRELGVPVEVFPNANAEAYYYNEDVGALSSTPVRHRTAKADYFGYVSELLAKAIDQGALDAELTADDREATVEFLRAFGALGPDDTYVGSERRGLYVRENGAGTQEGEFAPPFALSDLLASRFGFSFPFELSWTQAMLMFQPVGGMDAIPAALAGALDRPPIRPGGRPIGRPIVYGATVTAIEDRPDGVAVTYTTERGFTRQVVADYCVCTIPPQILRRIPSNLPGPVVDALGVPVPFPTGKIGLQYGRRFWEEDEHILGGITNTNLDINTIWYPGSGYLTDPKGIVVGYYNFGGTAVEYGELTPAQRQERALERGAKVHGDPYTAEFETAFSVPWEKVPHSEGGWVFWPERGAAYELLLEPAGRVYFSSDYLSYSIAWQHGAFESARKVVSDLHQRVLTAA